jgi:hypothetical protein
MNRHESSYSDASEKLELQMHILIPGWSTAHGHTRELQCNHVYYMQFMIAVRITHLNCALYLLHVFRPDLHDI